MCLSLYVCVCVTFSTAHVNLTLLSYLMNLEDKVVARQPATGVMATGGYLAIWAVNSFNPKWFVTIVRLLLFCFCFFFFFLLLHNSLSEPYLLPATWYGILATWSIKTPVPWWHVTFCLLWSKWNQMLFFYSLYIRNYFTLALQPNKILLNEHFKLVSLVLCRLGLFTCVVQESCI